MNTKFIIALMIGSLAVVGCGTPSMEEKKNIETSSSSQIPTTLSAMEIQDLLHMYEEEKLAHDVYLALGNTWNIPQFTNITSSESTHYSRMDSLLREVYSPDALTPNLKAGEFTSPAMKELYETLLTRGKKSLEEALRVGCEIEELDIADLENALLRTEHPSIKSTYTALNEGSKNHLRAFSEQLQRRGLTYIPKHISPSTYEEILSQAKKRGR